MSARILVAGIGNIFLGDDAFGVHVAQRLLERAVPEGVQVGDFGIQGFDLAFAMMDDYDATILVDAVPRGGEPGTLYLIDPELSRWNDTGQPSLATHGLNPVQVLQMVKQFGGEPGFVRIVGCEPATFGAEEGQMGLSEPVGAAVEPAIELIESLIAKLQGEVTGHHETNEQAAVPTA